MNILIVGLGSIAQKHISALRALAPLACVYALRSSRRRTKETGDVISIYSLNDAEGITFEFIIISNPTSIHIKTINDLISLGSPFFIEKPLSSSSRNIPTLIKRIQENSIKTYVACNLRFHPLIRFVKDNLHQLGKIEEVNVYCGSDLRTWREGKDFRNSYSARRDMGGGVHLDLIHELDYVYWFFGKPESLHRRLTSKSSLEIDSIDYANYSLAYSNFCVNIVLNYFRITPKRQLEIVAENSIWIANLLTGNIKDQNDEIVYSGGIYSSSQTYRDQMAFFMQRILQAGESFNTIEEAFEVLKISLDE